MLNFHYINLRRWNICPFKVFCLNGMQITFNLHSCHWIYNLDIIVSGQKPDTSALLVFDFLLAPPYRSPWFPLLLATILLYVNSHNCYIPSFLYISCVERCINMILLQFKNFLNITFDSSFYIHFVTLLHKVLKIMKILHYGMKILHYG